MCDFLESMHSQDYGSKKEECFVYFQEKHGNGALSQLNLNAIMIDLVPFMYAFTQHFVAFT